MQNTWPVSNKKFEEHANDTDLHYSGLPIGSVIWWSGLAEKRPSGFLLLDGSTYDTTLYSELYAILGTDVLPNYIGRFVKGSVIAGTEEEAGLPEIHGTLGTLAQDCIATGAFAILKEKQHVVEHSGNSYGSSVTLNASNGTVASIAEDGTVTYMQPEESPYGKSDTVTPENISAVPLIKAKHYATVYAPGSLDETLRVEHNELKDTVNAIKQTFTITKSSDTVELFNNRGSSVGSNTRYLRSHSDGYKEMWGVITIHSSTSNVVVELPDSFSDVHYNISQINSGTYGALTCGDLTNNSFTLTHSQSITTNFVIRWKATGY